mgnify:CR=1 FL=1
MIDTEEHPDRRLPLPRMHQHSYVGKRADKFTVTGTTEVDHDEIDGALVRSGVAKIVKHYTMTCPDEGCDGVGRYDERGEVVCPECGVVISGDKQVTLAVDFSNSRGFDGEDGSDLPGHSEPMI